MRFLVEIKYAKSKVRRVPAVKVGYQVTRLTKNTSSFEFNKNEYTNYGLMIGWNHCAVRWESGARCSQSNIQGYIRNYKRATAKKSY